MHFIWHVVVEYKHLLSWTYASKSHETQKIASAKWHKFARCFLCPSTIVLENDAKCLSLQYIIKISLLVHVCLEVGQTKKKTWKACCYNESTVYLLLFCFQVKLLFLPGPREDLLQPERENKWEGYCTLVVLVWSDAKLYYVVIWDNIIFCSTCTVLLKRTLIIVFVTDCSDILCF